MTSRIRAVLASLAAARDADPQRRVFGARSHDYRLNPPATETKIAELEARIGEPLPSEYRMFLSEAGDGGAGPYYGIHSIDDGLGELLQKFGSTDVLGLDCPLVADVDFGDALGKPDDWAEHVARLKRDPTYDAGYARLTEEYSEPQRNAGMLPICDFGCGDFFCLVVRGFRKGTIWVNSVDGSTGVYCTEVDFLTFYELWLEDVAARLRQGAFRPRNARYSFLQYSKNPRYVPA